MNETKSKAKRKGRRRASKAGNGQAAEGPSKAQLIRDAFAVMGLETRPKAVVDTLAERGVTVSTPQVIGVRNKLQEKRSLRRRKLKLKRRRAAKAAASALPETIALDALLAAKEVVEKLGSVDAANSAVAALERLGG